MLSFEQRNRLVATIIFICAGIYSKTKQKKGDCEQILSRVNHQLKVTGSTFLDQKAQFKLVSAGLEHFGTTNLT